MKNKRAQDQESIVTMEDSITTDEGTDLFETVRKRRLHVTNLLLDGGSSVNSIDGNGQNVLIAAILSTHEDVQSAEKESYVRFLLEKGADPNYTDSLGKTALIHVCEKRLGIALIRLLLEFKADATIADKNGMSPLLYVADAADEAILSLLAKACKAKGKDVIIVRPKVQKGSTDSASGNEVNSSGSNAPENVRCSEPANDLLSVPRDKSEDATGTIQRHSDGRPRVIGSPTPKPKLRNLPKEGNVSLEVPSPTDARIYSILRADSSSDDNLSLIHSPDAETTSKQGGRVRVLRRRNTADLFPASAYTTFTPPIRRKGIQPSKKYILNPLKRCSLDEVKASLLEWEKELTKTVDSCATDKAAAEQVPPLSPIVFRHPEIDVKLSACCDVFDSAPVKKTSSLKGLESIPREFLPPGCESPQGQRRVVGPGGRVLLRQGSGTRLFDSMAFSRPGTLPPLNVSVRRPIPGIGNRIASADDIHKKLGRMTRTPQNSVSSTPDTDSTASLQGRHDDIEAKIREEFFKKYVAEEKRVISHPSRKFFSKKSATLEMGEIIKLLSSEQRKCLPHVGEYGYGS